MLVLLWGPSRDQPLATVREELAHLGVPTLSLDQLAVLDTEVRLCVDDNITGMVRVQDRYTDLAAVSAVYVRPYDFRRLPAVASGGPDSDAWRHALTVEGAIVAWSELTPALVVNRLDAMATNNSKPYQLGQICGLGFSVPETLITTDPDAAQEFWEQHGDVVYKSISGIRSIVSRLQPEHAERLIDVKYCPTQFQRYVPGTDHRVHVVGNEVFASEIFSEADDYRYSGEHEVQVRACALPEDVEERCMLAAKKLDLPVAGIDLRRTPEGEWYCFEVNPSPAFTYYENRTDQPIGSAIAKLLSGGPWAPPEPTEADQTKLEEPQQERRVIETASPHEHTPAKIPDADLNEGEAAMDNQSNGGEVAMNNLTQSLQSTQDVGNLPRDEQKALATVAMESLPSEDMKDVVQALTLSPPAQGITNMIWLAIVIALVIVLLVAMGSLVVFTYEGLIESTFIPAILSAVLGYLVGLIHPSPVAQS